MKQIRAIISDADGTLVNTVYLIRHGQYATAVGYLIARGVPREDIPTYDVYESYINRAVGGSTRETFEKTLRLLFGKAHAQHLNKIDFSELNAALDPIQDHIATLYVHPFHGLTEMFSWLGKSKTDFGIFTSGDRRMILRNFGISLPALGFTELFRADDRSTAERLDAFITRTKAIYGIPKIAIVTCEDVTKTKPDPEGILKLMEQLNLNADEVIVLGDHAVDMQAAKAAGVHAIGISHGFGTPVELKEAGAVRVVDDLKALPRIIKAHNTGKSALF
ncbi:MAG: HAD family hydrolase [Candidatus Levyibacteriota bacterium]